MRFDIFIISILLIIPVLVKNLNAQESDKISNDGDISEVIETLAGRSDAELDYTSFVERLTEIADDPININNATEEDLQHLMFLTDYQIFNLLRYRKQAGVIHTPYELQFVYGFDAETVSLLEPFISFEETLGKQKSYSLLNSLKYGRHDLFVRYQRVLEEQEGYVQIPDSILADDPDKSRFLGSPDKVYLRYKYHYKNKLSFGLTAEKDAGEEFFRGTNKSGFDFYSGHFQVRDIGILKSLNLGDYSVQFGQGLVAWSSMSFGKGPSVMNVIRKGRGIYRYTSTNENQFLRGGAASVELGNFDFSAFYSNKSIDANISGLDTIDNAIESVTSFQNVGYHRTPNEINDERAINEQVAGGNIKFNKNNYRLGMTYAWYKYGAELIAGDSPDDLYDFSGNSFMNLGLDYRYQFRRLSLFGEFAANDQQEPAIISGFSVNPAPQIAISGVYRNVSPGYYAGYASSFGESGSIGNEKGFYLGTEIEPFAGWKFKGYFDMFEFPWLSYNASSPSDGYDWFTQLDYRVNRDVSMYWRIKGQSKDDPLNLDESEISLMLPEKILKARYRLAIEPTNYLRLKTQVEFVDYQSNEDEEREQGWLLSQDIIWQMKKVPLRFVTRFAVFRTDSYASRIYTYEYDVLYAFSIPAYYYHGKRFYLLAKYSPGDNIDIWLRFARTYYDNKNVISSGLTEIDAPHKTEIKAQVRFKF